MHRSVDEMRDGLKNAVELFISCIGEAEWNARREKVIDEVEAAVLGRPAGAGPPAAPRRSGRGCLPQAPATRS